MRVRVCAGREVVYNGGAYTEGGLIDAPDDVAEHWIASGDAKATLGAKPVRAPRSATPTSPRAEGK